MAEKAFGDSHISFAGIAVSLGSLIFLLIYAKQIHRIIDKLHITCAAGTLHFSLENNLLSFVTGVYIYVCSLPHYNRPQHLCRPVDRGMHSVTWGKHAALLTSEFLINLKT